MKTDTSHDAVIYCRSASVSQSGGENHLASQEARCREYAAQKRYEVLQIFRDEGISGNQTDRPGMQAMLSFLKDHSGTHQHAVIIDDISRLARSLETHVQLRAAIRDAGGKLESPSIEFNETPGKPLDRACARQQSAI